MNEFKEYSECPSCKSKLIQEIDRLKCSVCMVQILIKDEEMKHGRSDGKSYSKNRHTRKL
jgi:DNA-directed RNA polymerase subunit RPC12/RpoP